MQLFRGWTVETFLSAFANTLLGYGGISGLASVLTLAGRGGCWSCDLYGLAVTAAVVTAIPCVTPCCFLGQAVGVWAFSCSCSLMCEGRSNEAEGLLRRRSSVDAFWHDGSRR